MCYEDIIGDPCIMQVFVIDLTLSHIWTLWENAFEYTEYGRMQIGGVVHKTHFARVRTNKPERNNTENIASKNMHNHTYLSHNHTGL